MILEDTDLKEMGLPLGPRKKLISCITEQREQKFVSMVGHLWDTRGVILFHDNRVI